MKSAAELRRELKLAEAREAKWLEKYGPEPTQPGAEISVFTESGILGFSWLLGPPGMWAVKLEKTPRAFVFTWFDVCYALDECSDNVEIVISLPVSQDGAGS